MTVLICINRSAPRLVFPVPKLSSLRCFCLCPTIPSHRVLTAPQVGETLDREMHHSLFGDSGLGMDLGPLMTGPPAGDQLLPDIAAQLFDDDMSVASAQETPPTQLAVQGGEWEKGGGGGCAVWC